MIQRRWFARLRYGAAALLFFLCFWLTPMQTEAATDGMLTIICKDGDTILPNLTWKLYRVGSYSSSGELLLEGDFADYPVNGKLTTTAEVQMATEALVAAGVKAVFTPTDNTIMTAELSIYESFIEAGVQHYTGADSFALNGALVGYGVDYVQLGEATADMVSQLLCDGKTPADLPYQTFDNGIVTINTETCEALGLDLDTVKEAFKPYCTEICEVTTAENFS